MRYNTRKNIGSDNDFSSLHQLNYWEIQGTEGNKPVSFSVGPSPFRDISLCHDGVIQWKHFHVTGPLWGESTGHRWIPPTKDQ